MCELLYVADMNTYRQFMAVITAGLLNLVGIYFVHADSTIDASHPYAYGANIGWILMSGDGDNGASIGHAYCTGYVWSANTGWISLGNGPTNGWRYSNSSQDDWGVNHNGEGLLTGYGYSGNIGWICFEQTYGRPRINLRTGNLEGYAWSGNAGWISLSNRYSYVKTTTLDSGPDADYDQIPDYWEMRESGTLLSYASGLDSDNDGMTDDMEYLADTDPDDGSSLLYIKDLQRATGTNYIIWPARPTREYEVQSSLGISGDDWQQAVSETVFPAVDTNFVFTHVEATATSRFYRVKARIPLTP